MTPTERKLPLGWLGGDECRCLFPSPSHEKTEPHCVRCGEASFQDEMLRPTLYGPIHSSCISNARLNGEIAPRPQRVYP